MRFAPRETVLALLAIALVYFLGPTPAFAQEGMRVGPGGRVIRGGPGMRPGRPPSPNPSQGGSSKNEKDEDKKDEKKDGEDQPKDGESGEAESGESKPVTRPDQPPTPPDPRELLVEPDGNGRVNFSFHGQPWVDVLQWLAGVSKLSLDWREVPGDYLNLTTTRAYTLPEARDLINRHLQARGYTLLLSGEVLSVFKLEELEPSLVPRITEDELYDRQPHDIVKISLPLPPGMEATKAVEDLKQALGPHAKALPLAATKRVLLIDNVANLRMVSALLGAEIMAAEGNVVPREFLLQHVQASAVIDMLYVVLGLDPNTRPSQMELRLQQQKLELMGQMAQRGKDVMRLMDKSGPKVYLIYNRQRNSIIANAPPEQMEIIQRTIEALDVPKDGGGGAAVSLAADSERTLQQYQLKSISPSAVQSALEDIGDLSPRTELKADSDSKTLFARASTADHAKIKQLVEQLDSADAIVEVFYLRRLPADAVAGTVRTVLATPPKQDDEDDRRRRYYYRRQEKKPDPTELKVDADVANNRLIVRGTSQQIAEVRELLIKLGEPLDQRVDRRRVRVLDALSPDETRQLLERVKAAWPSVGGGNELVLPADTPAETTDAPEEKKSDGASELTSNPSDGRFRLLADRAESPVDDSQPAVSVQLDAAGRLVLSSDDTQALDKLQELVSSLSPAPGRFEVFQVKNRSPKFIVEKLETYFAEELAGKQEPIYTSWGEFAGYKDAKPDPLQLSRRREMRFMDDDWSSSILVANASSQQLAEIKRLIDAWDRQPLNDRILGRRTETVKLSYAKASTVVSALKDVYRDMLSSGDREFDTPEKKAFDSLQQYLTTIRYDDEQGIANSTEPTAIGFDGLLSLGSDDEANVVIVSANEEVFDTVKQTIRELDERAKPTASVAVRAIEGGVAAEEVRSALIRALGTESASSGSRSSRDRDRDDDRRRYDDRRRRR